MTEVRMLGVTLSLMVVLAPSSVFAQSVINPTMCAWYRNSAISDAAVMRNGDIDQGGQSYAVKHGQPKPIRKSTCSSAGDRYSPNAVVHDSWCASVDNIDKLADESIARLQQINGCYSNRSAMCFAYAKDAQAAHNTNASGPAGASCGYSGPRYNPDFAANYNWCMSAPLTDVYGEVRGRTTDMDRCNRCQEYALDAKAARDKATGRGCKLSGPRWSTNPQDHVGWCMSANLSSAVAAKNDRWHEALNCTP